MQEIRGKYASAKIYADVVEQAALDQIQTLCDQPFAEGSHIAVMPDVHAGAGCTIGFTMTVNDKVCPNLVGVDIGCGVLVVELGNIDIDFKNLDEVIHSYIPSGLGKINQNMSEDEYNRIKEKLSQLYIWNKLSDKKKDEMIRSCGSLGT